MGEPDARYPVIDTDVARPLQLDVTLLQSAEQYGQFTNPGVQVSQNCPAKPGKQVHSQLGGLPRTADARPLQLTRVDVQSRRTQVGQPP